MVKARYKVDFPRQMAEGELNYSRLMRLLPDIDACDCWRYLLGCSEVIELQVVERARYTTFLKVAQLHKDNQPWQVQLELQVRLYHDAGMAEVVGWNRHRQIKPCYDYPNDSLYHCDEKAQQNVFLGEWLSHCLQNGRTEIDLLAAAGFNA